MCIDTHISCCTRETLSLSIRNMLLRLWITVLFCHTKIDQVDHIRICRSWSSNQEIIRFYISINQVVLMDALNPCNLNSLISFFFFIVLYYLLTICLANMATVLILNFLEQLSNKSSRLGPSKSITRML